MGVGALAELQHVDEADPGRKEIFRIGGEGVPVVLRFFDQVSTEQLQRPSFDGDFVAGNLRLQHELLEFADEIACPLGNIGIAFVLFTYPRHVQHTPPGHPEFACTQSDAQMGRIDPGGDKTPRKSFMEKVSSIFSDNVRGKSHGRFSTDQANT